MASPDDRVLALPPTPRDGEVTQALLAAAGVECRNCASLAELGDEMTRGVGAILLTDIAVLDPWMPRFLAALASQPAWSDVPVVMLAREREAPPQARAIFGRLTNMTVLDRPVSTRSMLSTLQAALRARQRQYQIRDHIERQARAETALREADRRKDEFLATLAHELRNPLAPLRTGISLLKSRPPGSEATPARVIEVMERQLVMLVKLIDELLDVARISSGKIELKREWLDLRAVVEAAVEGSAPGVEAARHKLSVQLPPEPVWAQGDRTRLAQVFGNLINNACKYTPDGGRIALTLEPVEGWAVVRVSDNGVGIAPEMLARVFDMFTQVEGSLYRSQGGLGLGLSLVRSLVQMHGGTVHAASDGPHKGSVFTVTLPRSATPPQLAPPPLQAPAPPRRALRVLVIDDNVDAAEVMVLSLQGLGHAARCEHSGATGVQAAQSFRPEVVFCDIGMPGFNGYEVAARLRQDPALAGTWLVALTGWGGAGDKQRAADAGFDDHLTKPASAEQIAAALATAEARRPWPAR